MNGHVSISQVARFLSTSEREHGLYLDGEKWGKLILCAQLFTPLHHTHRPLYIEAIAHLCISKWNRPTPVWRWLSLTHAGLGKLNPSGVG